MISGILVATCSQPKSVLSGGRFRRTHGRAGPRSGSPTHVLFSDCSAWCNVDRTSSNGGGETRNKGFMVT